MDGVIQTSNNQGPVVNTTTEKRKKPSWIGNKEKTNQQALANKYAKSKLHVFFGCLPDHRCLPAFLVDQPHQLFPYKEHAHNYNCVPDWLLTLMKKTL